MLTVCSLLGAAACGGRHIETTQKVSDPITFRRFAATPFLLGAWWSSGGVKGGATVLVCDGIVQSPHGIADLPACLTFLGETRTRALDVVANSVENGARRAGR